MPSKRNTASTQHLSTQHHLFLVSNLLSLHAMERPVRESAPPPPKSAGPPVGILLMLALAILFGVAILLGVGGQFAGWIVAGVIALAGGIMLVVRLAKQNREP